jgi:hypothetical protein
MFVMGRGLCGCLQTGYFVWYAMMVSSVWSALVFALRFSNTHMLLEHQFGLDGMISNAHASSDTLIPNFMLALVT